MFTRGKKSTVMAKYSIHAQIDGSYIKSVEKRLREAFPDSEERKLFLVTKEVVAESRQDRLNEAETKWDDAKSIVEELKGEMEEWHESIPENLQDGEKANEVQECIDALDNLYGEMDNISFSDISFPGMY
jgi:predicted translin family RNA/ssDNA-binding protein